MNRRSFLSQMSQLCVTAQFAPGFLTGNAMAENNQRRTLSFSNEWIESTVVKAVHDLPIEDAIVVNLANSPLHYTAGANQGIIAPWKSTVLRQCTLNTGETAALLHVRQRTNLGGIALHWDWYGRRNPQFPRGTPLYISSQDEVGEVQMGPLAAFYPTTTVSPTVRSYRLKLNLWYTPEETDCGIHTGHQFLEVHTQLLGTGHMQKFRENKADSMYEDVWMPPGFTHDPFFSIAADRSFSYPWHRYYADTDCIWMAIELHQA